MFPDDEVVWLVERKKVLEEMATTIEVELIEIDERIKMTRYPQSELELEA